MFDFAHQIDHNHRIIRAATWEGYAIAMIVGFALGIAFGQLLG